MDDFDRQLRKLLDDETAGIRLDQHGTPIDPAQTIRHDREMLLRLDQRQRETMQLKAQERAEITAHWDRWERIQDRQDAHRSHAQAHQGAAPVVVNINLGGAGAPYYQPAPPVWQPQVGPLFTPAQQQDERRFNRRVGIAIATLAILTLAMLWLLAAAMQVRAQQYLAETTTQTQEMPWAPSNTTP